MPGMTVREQVEYVGWLSGLSRARARDQVDGVLNAVDLQDKASARSSHLSGGQLRRVGVAEAIIGGDSLILLDEPTAGLDPEQRVDLREVLSAIKERGTSLVVSTHQTDDLYELFDHVVVIDAGKLLFHGSLTSFLARAPDAAHRPTEEAYLMTLKGAR